jgi:hypothetical protein
MKSTHRLSQEILTMFFSSYIGCLIIGYIFFQSQIFILNLVTFQFVTGGAMAVVFFNLLRFSSVRNALAGYFVICIFVKGFVVTSFAPDYLLRDVLYFAVIGFAVYLYWRYSYKEKINWNNPFQLAGLFSVLNIIMTIILIIYGNASYKEFAGALTMNLSIGFLIGLGMGIGIEAGNYFIEKLPVVTEEDSISVNNNLK